MSDNVSAGATPVVAGATPAQTPPASPAAGSVTPASPATGDPDALGDAGKRALDAMKAERDAAQRAAKAAEKALEDLKLQGATEAEKAIAKAKSDGAAEVTERANAKVRRSEVKAALASSGINPSVLDLAIGAPEFASLKVTEDGEVEGLKEAIATFKGTRADLFKPAAAAGSSDLGAGGRPSGKTFTREQLRDHEFFKANEAEINRAVLEGRITDETTPGR